MPPFLAFFSLLTWSSWWAAADGILSSGEDGVRPLCSRSCGAPEEAGVTPDSLLRFRCSCSPSCALYGDCCHDSPHRNASMWQQFQFACVSVAGRDRYRVVSSCPPPRRSDFCREALGHLPPVTSRLTNVTYGNVFCAACNGDRDKLTTWTVELRCPSADDEEEDRDERMTTTRVVYSLRNFWKIDERSGSKRLCQFHVLSDDRSVLDGLELRTCDDSHRVARCSESWRDADVLEKCRSYQDPIYFHDTAYQNAHCALCNYLSLEFGDCVPFHVRSALQRELRTDPGVLEYCKGRRSEACVRYLSEKRRGRPLSLSHLLLNVKVWECVPPDCCEGQRYDFRTRKCRKVRVDG